MVHVHVIGTMADHAVLKVGSRIISAQPCIMNKLPRQALQGKNAQLGMIRPCEETSMGQGWMMLLPEGRADDSHNQGFC